MNREILVNRHLPYSVLFPEVHRLVKYALVRYFHVLQLRCVKSLLEVCAEKLTRIVIALPEKRNVYTDPFLNLKELDSFGLERIDTLVNHWHNQMSMYDDPDIARVVFPRVICFVQNQILLKEPGPPFRLSDNDIVALSMLLVKNTNVHYKGKNWWQDERQIARTFEHWFVEAVD